MLHQHLKPIAAVAILTLGVLAGTNLSAQEQAPQNKPGGGGMMGHEGMPDGMMGMMFQMSQMMQACTNMMQAQATPPAQPPANGNEPQPQPRG